MRAGARKITVLAALLALGGALGPLEAQEPEEAARRGCRCVDGEGEEIESCVCVRTPDVSRIVARATSLRRARLGVELDRDPPAEVERLGVRIEDVAEASPADEAGLRTGDVLVSVAGRHLLNPLPDEDREDALDEDASLPVQRLVEIVGELEPGEAVEVRYLRDGVERRTTVVPEEWGTRTVSRLAPRIRILGDSMRLRGDSLRALGDTLRARLRRGREARTGEVRLRRHQREQIREHEARARELAERIHRRSVRMRPERALVAPRPPGGVWLRRGTFGLELVELNPDLADYFDAERGVLVTDVDEGSELGLRPGDVIVAVGEREVEDVSDVRRILRSYEPGEEIRFRVVREGGERTVRGELEGGEGRDGS